MTLNKLCRYAMVGILLSFFLLAGCRRTPGAGQVEIRLTADLSRAERLEALNVGIESVRVHRAGRPLETGWVSWPPTPAEVDLTSFRHTEPISLGVGEVPAGRYDRVQAVIESGQASRIGGTPVPLIVTVEPIALPFELEPQTRVTITIELIALAQDDTSYELFTKAAKLSSQ
jgi:hypothetical protein